MIGGLLIEEGRLRAGISRGELASRLGVSEEQVARWEGGAEAPAFDEVVRALRAAGFALRYHLESYDPGEIGLIDEHLALDPAQRLDRLLAVLAWERELQDARLLGPLSEHPVPEPPGRG